MKKTYIAGLGIAVVAIVISVAFFIGLPFGNASIEGTSSPMTANPGEMATLCTQVKNSQPYKSDYMMEVGVIPRSVAEDWFPAALSIFGNSRSGECCTGQLNIEDRFITLGPKESRKVCMEVNVPYQGIKDKCGNADYWTGEGNYRSYFMVSNHCHYKNGQEQEGFEMYDVETSRIRLNK